MKAVNVPTIVSEDVLRAIDADPQAYLDMVFLSRYIRRIVRE